MIKRLTLILLITVLISVSGCTDKKMYLPEAENDKIFTVIGK